MKIEINIDEYCVHCKEGLKYFKELQKKHPNCYANMNMKEWTYIAGLYLTPDYNSCGHLTHFHLSKGAKKTLIGLAENMYRMEADSKKLKKIMRKNK